MKGGKISISTVDGRKKYQVIPNPSYADWEAVSCVLKVTKDRCILHVQYEKGSPPVKEWTSSDVLGIDRGITNIIATSDNKLVNSKHLRNVKGKYRHVRSELQSKGTRSASRRYRAISGKERRFVRDVNHCISKTLVESDHGVFALEDLKGIRKGRKNKATRKKIGSWSFNQLQEFIEYKAEAVGKQAVYVDPKFTSQQCSHCGHTAKKNRQGSSFLCTNCGFSLNADLNASRNIARLGIARLCRAGS
jgi:IS605 OrfB family transposase